MKIIGYINADQAIIHKKKLCYMATRPVTDINHNFKKCTKCWRKNEAI